MIYFIVIFILLSTLMLLESINKKIISPIAGILVFIVLVLFAALRPAGADHDYETYLSFFSTFNEPSDYLDNIIVWGFFEPFYYLVPSILRHWLHLEYYQYITLYLYAFVGCLIVMLAIRKLTTFYFASILTLFCNFFLLHEMTQIRAAIAVGIFLLCIYYKEQKRWSAFCFCVVVSTLFHYSSLLALPILFLADKSLNRPLFITLTLLSFAFSFVDFSMVLAFFNFDAGALSAKQDYYVNSIQDEMRNRRSFIFLLHFINTLILIAFSERIYIDNKYIYILIKIQVVGLLAFQILSASPTISSRVADYYLSVHIVTLSSALCLFQNKFWPALVFSLLNLGVLLTLLLRSNLIDLNYYTVPIF
jgi:hypothetical protein